MEKKNINTNRDNKKRIILMIIALIIIALALLTSCSCASKFFGKIGSLFRNEGLYIYKEKEGNFCEGGLYCETVINKNLNFDLDKVNISATDEDIKLTYNYYGIIPKKFTCTTSDASIATCYVNSNGYVVVIPKSEGTVIVTLQTEENDKIYEATATVTIGASKNGIFIEQNKGTIDLRFNNKKTVFYTLVGIKGKVTVTSSDESIATATIKDGLLKITAYKPGKVEITLTAEENGNIYKVIYELNVIKSDGITPGKDSNSLLSNLTTDKGLVSPTFTTTIKNYVINISADDTDITVTATPNNKNSNVLYQFGDVTNTTGYFDNLQTGKNIISIIVTGEDGTVNVYTLSVNKPDKDSSGSGGGGSTSKPSNNANLSSLYVNGSPLPGFSETKYNYVYNRVGINDTSITVKANPSGKAKEIKYELNGRNCPNGHCEGLMPGKNIVVVTVTAEDGITTKTYEIIVNRPFRYVIKVNSTTCIHGEDECKIGYVIEDTNGNALNFDLDSLDVKTDNFAGEIEKNKDYIILKPDKDNIPLVDYTVNLDVSYKKDDIDINNKFNVKFIDNYYAKPQKETYPAYVNEKREIIVDTNMFSKDNKGDLAVTGNGTKTLIITSKANPNLSIEISTTSNAIKSLKYNQANGISSMPIDIEIGDIKEDAEITIVKKIYGRVVETKKTTLNIYKAYTVHLQAGKVDKDGNIIEGGMFNSTKVVYEIPISAKDGERVIDLSQYSEPYKLTDDPCKAYKFIGFYDESDPDKNIIYSIKGSNNKITYSDSITSDIYLMAVYDESTTIEKPSETELWIRNVPLFCNENDEFCKEHNGEKIIYPGARGRYDIKLGNIANYDIEITDMILKEETICVDLNQDGKVDGCLNMGYNIKDSSGQNIFNVNINGKYDYKLLHKEPKDITTNDRSVELTYQNVTNRYYFDQTINSFTPITVPAGTEEETNIVITIHWEWINYDDYEKGGTMDKVDTAIGNYAYEQNKIDESTTNDLYTLKVGFKIKEKKVCSGS